MPSTTTLIPDVKVEARQMARNVLVNSDVFKGMPLDEQRSIYMNLVDEYQHL